MDIKDKWIEIKEWGLVNRGGLGLLQQVGALARFDDRYVLTSRGLALYSTKQIMDTLNFGQPLEQPLIDPNTIPTSKREQVITNLFNGL